MDSSSIPAVSTFTKGMPLLGMEPWTFWTKAFYGVSTPRLALLSPSDFDCVYLEVLCSLGEVRDWTLNSFVGLDMSYLPMLCFTVLETSTVMLG